MFKKLINKNIIKSFNSVVLSSPVSFDKTGDYLLCLCRGVIIFLLIVGGMGFYTSSFGIKLNFPILLGFVSIFSLLFSFIHLLKSRIIRNLLYFAYVFLFLLLALTFKVYINSGYHAILNISYAAIQNYFDIPAFFSYLETIEDSYVTITVFLCFLGTFVSFLLNMWFNTHVNLLTIFIVTFLPNIVPLYINLRPALIYVFLLCCGYISLLIIRFSLHSVADRYCGNPLKINSFNSKTPVITYSYNGFNYLSSLLYSVIICALIFVFTNIVVPYNTFNTNRYTNPYKNQVDSNIKYFLENGFFGYFNHYSSTGGLNMGRLGGIYQVVPDYKTDLVVTYVPQDTNPFYLKSFVGADYSDRHWSYDSDNSFSSKEFNCLVNNNRPIYSLDITNIDADPFLRYIPYYSDYEEASDSFLKNNKTSYTYSPYHDVFNSSVYNEPMDKYLKIDNDTLKSIRIFLRNNYSLSSYLNKGIITSSRDIDFILEELSSIFERDFKYTLSPGVTPFSYSFIDHFLNYSKEGYCAHFATGATLILRALGIPARYVEGYVITIDELSKGIVNDDLSKDNYILYGASNIDDIITVNVADDKAHAWVEYLDPYFGWRVFEATTAPIENEEEPLFQNFLEMFSTDNYSTNNLLTLIICFIIILFILIIIVWTFKYIKTFRSYHRKYNNYNVRNYYKVLCKKISRKHPEFDYIISMDEQVDFIINHSNSHKTLNDSFRHCFVRILLKAQFSNEEVTVSEYKFAMKYIKYFILH